jgi:hypothetical protein
VQALLVSTALVAVWLTFEQAQQVDCQARYNRAAAEYDASRADAANRDRAALESLVRSLLDPTGDSFAEAQRYLDTLEQTNRERAENPVVPPPADLCS